MVIKKVLFCLVFITLLSFPAWAKSTVMTKDTVPPSPGNTVGRKIFERVEIEASFPGGEKGWRDFLTQNLNPSVPADKGAPTGKYTVYIQFVVGKEGKIDSIKPLTTHGYGMEEEVERVIRKSPDWTPAVQNGRKVNAYRRQSITFGVEGQKKKKRRKDN